MVEVRAAFVRFEGSSSLIARDTLFETRNAVDDFIYTQLADLSL